MERKFQIHIQIRIWKRSFDVEVGNEGQFIIFKLQTFEPIFCIFVFRPNIVFLMFSDVQCVPLSKVYVLFLTKVKILK